MRKNRAQSEVASRRLPRVNFRPILFCALGLAFGIFLYCKIRFGGLKPSDFLFLGIFVFFAIRPYSAKRMVAVALCLAVTAGIGTAGIHIYTSRYLAGAPEGEYEVTGTVLTCSVGDGYASAVLCRSPSTG